MIFEEIKKQLGLEPLEPEGGFFKRTYTSTTRDASGAPTLSAIYYLITATQFSHFHRVTKDEIFHFYAGSTVELLQISPSGELTVTLLSGDVLGGHRPQVVVPAGYWQALRLANPAKDAWSLMGTTVTPAFEFSDFEIGEREALSKEFPQHASLFTTLCPK